MYCGEEPKRAMPVEGKHLRSSVESMDYDVSIDVHICYKQGTETVANERATELLGSIAEQLNEKK